MATETERKFLIDGDFTGDVVSSAVITQGYLSSSGKATVRVRITDGRGYITVKGPSDSQGLSRYEWEKEISPEDASDMLILCGSGIISKTRHIAEYSGHRFEVDVFMGDNEGLVIAEIELSSADEHFEKPSWLGREVTGDRRYYNSFLASNPFKGWKNQ